MGAKEPIEKPSTTGWFIGKLVRTPAAWLGLGAAVFTGWAAFGASIPLAGAIGFGGLVGFAVGMLSFLIGVGIKTSHQRSLEITTLTDSPDDRTTATEKLRAAGLTEDAELLEKIHRDQDAIRDLCRKETENPNVEPMVHLVTTIVGDCELKAQILEDLIRRTQDPLLESPEDAREQIENIRSDWERAYRAIADVRTLLLEDGFNSEVDLLEESPRSAEQGLIDLVSKLEEETGLSRRVKGRLHLPIESGIVMEDPILDSTDAAWERE